MKLLKTIAEALKRAGTNLPAPETYEATNIHRPALAETRDAIGKIDAALAEAEQAVKDAAEGAKKEGIQAGREAALAEIKDTHVAKADHDAAVKSAADAASKSAREAAKADYEAQLHAAAERSKLASEGGIPAVTAEKVADAALAPAAAADTRKKLSERVASLTKLGFTAEADKDLFAACAEGLDEAGDKAFADRLALLKRAQDAGKAAGKAGASAEDKNRQKVNPAAGGARKDGEPDDKIIL